MSRESWLIQKHWVCDKVKHIFRSTHLLQIYNFVVISLYQISPYCKNAFWSYRAHDRLPVDRCSPKFDKDLKSVGKIWMRLIFLSQLQSNLMSLSHDGCLWRSRSLSVTYSYCFSSLVIKLAVAATIAVTVIFAFSFSRYRYRAWSRSRSGILVTRNRPTIIPRLVTSVRGYSFLNSVSIARICRGRNLYPILCEDWSLPLRHEWGPLLCRG